MPSVKDGPHSQAFSPVPLRGNATITELAGFGISSEMVENLEHAPSGKCVCWGIRFEVEQLIVLQEKPFTVDVGALTAPWLVFMHTSDRRPMETGPDGFYSPMRGGGRLAEHAADYVIVYAGGGEERAAIRRRHQIGAFQRRWGENCFEAVGHHKPYPRLAGDVRPGVEWGWTQTRATAGDGLPWINWLWAWENPHPGKAISAVRFEPVAGTLIISAVSAGTASSQPLRWRTRQKACLTLPEGEVFLPALDEEGSLQQVQLDMGQVISATPRLLYPHGNWSESDNNRVPPQSENQVLLEYAGHPDACFHITDGSTLPLGDVVDTAATGPVQFVPPVSQVVKLRAVEQESGRPVPVKLHVHGEWGEYLAPIDRHRIINPGWFEDYSADIAHTDLEALDRFHSCTYIPGETTLRLPLGRIYVEVSKGFEIRPLRRVFDVTPETTEITIELEKVLPWREKGWVTADTHVHFLSPMSALLEGAAEGVNVVNLLASQWAELMTNVGDFDGKTTWGSVEAGGDGEYLVRVGTENRQHVLGHISLLGYEGQIIAPMTTGGPDESALGDPIEVLLTEWARQCKAQGGVVVLPHFPNPRAEAAASIVSGDVDGIEMTSWGNLYGGIDPYSLSDWYRYLNCGYLVAAVGGTDKMSARTAVGTVRTYARIDSGQALTYDAWMEAIRRAETFVTYGPLLEFAVDGQPMGARISMTGSGGTVDVTWEVASVTVPMTRVELVVNGEIRESTTVSPWQGAGHWPVRVEESAWLALLVRGHYPEKPEIIAAHSTPVMIDVEGSPMLAAADGVTILEQIEGALAYLDTVGIRAEERAYKRMRLVLESAHRTLHNRMHQLGHFHEHNPMTLHRGH